MIKSETNKYVIGITQGDINGVGYEVILKTLADKRIYEDCTVVIYGSSKVAGYYKKALNINCENLFSIKDVNEAEPGRINIINVSDDNVRVELGKSTDIAGKNSAAALERCIADMQEGKVDILVTAPINKNNINEAGFHFPGHTEYLAESFKEKDVLMLMTSPDLKIGVVTGHIPLKDVAGTLTIEKIVNKLNIINKTMRNDFTIRKPRIAVLGLNPHAGDNGLLGNEEQEIIIPAIEEAEKEGIMCFGPYPSDGFFASGNYKKFDAVLAMYHDQGLIPFKTIAGSNGVNYTAGLPVIRTSPDHGTAYDLAGKGEADETSFKEALFTGIDIYNNRMLLKGITPLKKQTQDIADKKIC